MSGFRFQLLVLIILSGLLLPISTSAQKQVPDSQTQMQLSFAPLVKKSAPAVVSIFTSGKIKVNTVSPFMNDPFFQHFFGNSPLFSPFGLQREKMVSSLGSGVIVRGDGLIISNNHVVGNNTEIKVVLNDRREFEADIVLTDERSDLAVLKLRGLPAGEHLPYLNFADSDSLEVGDLVLAIGNPFGVGQTVTSGIVSALARTNVEVADLQYFIQTDAAINPGNSGGALIDMNGQVVGINTAIFTKSGGSNGIGFATPSNMVRAVIHAASEGGKIVRPWLGAISQNIDQALADSLGLKRPVGVLVKSVYPESAAEKGGLKIGDVIVSVDGKEVEDEKSLRFRIATFTLGEKINFEIIRKSESKNLIIEMMPAIEIPKRNETKIEGDSFFSGLVVANLSPALAEEMDMRIYSGVIITGVWNRSPAKQIGLGRGDIIKEINGEEIQSVKHLRKIIDDLSGAAVQITIIRGDQTLSVSVR